MIVQKGVSDLLIDQSLLGAQYHQTVKQHTIKIHCPVLINFAFVLFSLEFIVRADVHLVQVLLLHCLLLLQPPVLLKLTLDRVDLLAFDGLAKLYLHRCWSGAAFF
jgi:hypothetical protein